MQIDLHGKVACVTGSATGIGRAIGEALAEAGATAAFNHHGQAALAGGIVAAIHARGGRAQAFDADVTDADAVAAMMEAIDTHCGQIDILVNNAGILLAQPFMDMTEEAWSRVIRVDLTSVFLCSQAALQRMLARGSGCIINVASELAYLGRAEFTAYCAAKAGVVNHLGEVIEQGCFCGQGTACTA